MSQLETDFSGAPYWDDYDPSKGFYRILIVPARAVQTRELNQVQTIIQEQIRRFGNHVFKDGSIVDGCNITHLPNFHYVRLNNSYVNDNANNALDESIYNFLLVSDETDTRAVVRLVKVGYEAQYPDTNTFYIDYIKTGRDISNNEVKTFTSGELIHVYDIQQGKFDDTLNPARLYNSINVFTPDPNEDQEAVGTAVGVTVGDGFIFQKGYFIRVEPHTITVRDYDNDTDGMLVGFETNEEIITHLQDSSLIDPSDTSQRNAIGADRLRLQPKLVARLKTDITDDDDFFPIITYGEREPVVQKIDPEYSKLGDVMGMRTYEESGDYYTKPFITSTTTASNTENFRYSVSPGIGYVKGNRVELISTIYLDAPRATTTDSINASIITLNYGNYITVNELVGIFNTDQFAVIDIYDTPQSAITDQEGSGPSPSGTKIGTAIIRNIVYDSGVKGTPNCRYRAYITDIQIDSGYSFINNAKSFHYNGSTGRAKADIVLEDDQAIIRDVGKNSLIFNTGLDGLSRLRDPNGVNDTHYIFRDQSQATLQANGSVTFTLNMPHAGGYERFFASPGSLSNINELRVDVITTAAMYSSNQIGTVDSTTVSGNNLNGAGTTFLSTFKPGEYIRIDDGSEHIRRIVSIANNTSMTLNSGISGGNAAANYSKYFLAGTVIDLDAADVTVLSDTQFTVDLPFDIDAGAPQTLTAMYPVFRTQAVEIRKNVRKNRYVKIDCSANTTGPFNLGLTDVYKIHNVWIGDSYSSSNPDRAAWFQLDNGQTDTHYDHAKLVLKPQYRDKLGSSSRILVQLSHFEANTTGGVGFFSVDSYPVMGPSDTANNTNISYSDIPTHGIYDLRNCIDYRPYKFNTANSSTTEGGATINPSPANSSFNITASGSYLAEPDSTFQADVEYYLPRIDLIQVNKDGDFNIKSSVPGIKPLTPVADNDSMPISVSYVPPFPSLASSERNTFGRDKAAISVNLRGNRGYTMRDINALDNRITRLEYYQTLSMLESSAKDMVIKDENGLDRFKNGIFADPFKNHTLGDVSNFEYNIAIDEDLEIARPKFTKRNIDLAVANTSNFVVSNHVAHLPHTPVVFAEQPYASKFRNVTESVWNWSGDLYLFPEYDHHSNESIDPDVNITIDLASPWEEFANSPFGQQFGDWRTTGSTTTSNTTSDWGRNLQTTTTTTRTTSARNVVNLDVNSSLTTHNLGSYVTDITLNPYIKGREVAFIANGLKPNSRFYAHFDKIAVSQHCAPGAMTSAFDPDTNTISTPVGRENEVIRRVGNWGTPLISDSNGTVRGVFNIPEGEFRVGDREFLICDVDDLEVGADAITSAARKIFTASSMSTTTNSININTIEPSISSRTSTETRVSTTTNITQRQIWTPSESSSESDNSSLGSMLSDPIGQSMYISTPDGVPGIFADSIDVFFRTKDPNMGVTLYISEVVGGVPDSSKIVAKSYMSSSLVKTSNDGTEATNFKFADIPYLTRDKYYAFFIKPDGDSPEYTIWMSEIGMQDIASGVKIFSNPYIGTAFKSANSTSWDVLQTEDIKFTLYRCNFTAMQGSIEFTDQNDDYFSVDGFSYANSDIRVSVGDEVYKQNTTGGVITGSGAPYGIVQFVDTTNDLLIIDGSTGNFTANDIIQIHRGAEAGNAAIINANTRIATSTIEEIINYDYSVVVPRVGTVTPTGTFINHEFKGRDAGENQDGTWKNLQSETEFEFIDKTRVIRSQSNKIANDSFTLKVNGITNSSWITPIIDLRRRSIFAIENMVNDDITDEHTRYGNALSKYISKRVVLAEGQDAEDIRVFVTGYRPADTDIHCYIKVLNADDPDTFESKLWTKLDMTAGVGVTSSIADVNDYREFAFGFPTDEAMQGQAYTNAGTRIVEYRNGDGTVFSGYKSFALKIVLSSSKKERVPRVHDIRAIALQT